MVNCFAKWFLFSALFIASPLFTDDSDAQSSQTGQSESGEPAVPAPADPSEPAQTTGDDDWIIDFDIFSREHKLNYRSRWVDYEDDGDWFGYDHADPFDSIDYPDHQNTDGGVDGLLPSIEGSRLISLSVVRKGPGSYEVTAVGLNGVKITQLGMTLSAPYDLEKLRIDQDPTMLSTSLAELSKALAFMSLSNEPWCVEVTGFRQVPEAKYMHPQQFDHQRAASAPFLPEPTGYAASIQGIRHSGSCTEADYLFFGSATTPLASVLYEPSLDLSPRAFVRTCYDCNIDSARLVELVREDLSPQGFDAIAFYSAFYSNTEMDFRLYERKVGHTKYFIDSGFDGRDGRDDVRISVGLELDLGASIAEHVQRRMDARRDAEAASNGGSEVGTGDTDNDEDGADEDDAGLIRNGAVGGSEVGNIRRDTYLNRNDEN